MVAEDRWFPIHCASCIETIEREQKQEHDGWLARQRRESFMSRMARSGVSEEYASGKLRLRTFVEADIVRPDGWLSMPASSTAKIVSADRIPKINKDRAEQSDQIRRELAAIAYIERFIADRAKAKRKGFYIYGAPGLGKSHFLEAATVAFARLGKQVIFVDFKTILKEVQATYSDDAKSESGALSRYLNVEVLALDDLGASEKASAFSLGILYDVLNHRVKRNVVTMMSSNYDLVDLARRILPKDENEVASERVIERIVEIVGGEGGLVELVGESYRGR